MCSTRLFVFLLLLPAGAIAKVAPGVVGSPSLNSAHLSFTLAPICSAASMKRIYQKFLWALAGLLALFAFGYSFAAYFIISFHDGQTHDGLGRLLTEAPTFLKIYWGWEQWPGLKYTIIDLLVFWGTLGIAYFLFGLAPPQQDEA